ncbi:protein serine/threonine phosphatase 2C [Auriscalpium vulgare]|uniref:Protein serine/threonine phosphatase 2C n=1 Tax=Auriscalpium vulgare TaxID=40419 RepID=A0ACB8SAZ1_9AGAM|nr:protein serine/threonine phosphatase 2C [Auriscalpium vulgare]
MLRRVWKPVAATVVVVGAPAYLYTRSRSQSTRPAPEQTFDISVRDGSSMGTRTVTLQSKADIDRRLREFATLESTATKEGLVWKHATARLASNDPIEDANAQAIIPKPAAVVEDGANAVTTAGELLFFAVMDGHGGFSTSRLLSKVLIPAVALELNALINPSYPSTSTALPSKSIYDTLKSYVVSAKPSTTPDPTPKQVSQAIQRAFSNLDYEIVNAPLRVLAAATGGQLPKGEVPDLSAHPMAVASMMPALSGSCALLAVLDTSARELYVACTGDSRAVAGFWDETPDGKGTWRVEVLSEDQTGRTPAEAARIRSEHPAAESEDVIKRGRILGGLEPSRAFGDARYKWPREVQETLYHAFISGTGKSMRAPPPLLKTPPYVTATPVVTHQKLAIPSLDQDSASPKSTLRFLVLATDGLWDALSSTEVVSLVAGHLSGLIGPVPKSQLPDLIPTTTGTPTVDGKDKAKPADQDGKWVFEEENVGAHLIRNAFGGGDEGRVRRLMSIPAPHSRRWRDDVTVTVVWWEDGQQLEEKIKAKL